MRKRYLKNIEDIEALRNTDTKIYKDHSSIYFKFVKGILCCFFSDGDVGYNCDILLREDSPFYIEVEDEPSEDDIGKIGWFSDSDDADDGFIDVLEEIEDGEYITRYDCAGYHHFRPLTPEEVEKYTGYKVVKEK